MRDVGFLGDVGGESKLRESGELAVRAGAVFGACDGDMLMEVRSRLGLSGLVRGEALGETEGEMGVRSVGGRGDSGTFHKLASSGKSSSKSSYSSSSSFVVFLFGCHEPRLTGGVFMFWGARPGLLSDGGPGIGLGNEGIVFGEGDRERFRLLIAVIAKDGVDGLLIPLLGNGPNPLGRLSEFVATCPFVGP